MSKNHLEVEIPTVTTKLISTYEAIKSGNLDLIEERIVSRKIHTDFKHGGMSALHIATQYSQVEIIDALLKSGANINEATEKDSYDFHHEIPGSSTALHLAAKFVYKNKGQEILKKLINFQVDINCFDLNIETALSILIKNNKFDMAKTILQQPSAEFNQNLIGKTFSYILETKDLELLNLVIAKMPDGASSVFDKKSLLFRAVEEGNFEVFTALVGAKANVNFIHDPTVTNKHDTTKGSVLSLAVQKDNLPMVNALIDAGSNATDPSLLYRAIKSNNLEIVKALIDGGSPATDPSLLYTAIKSNNLEIVKALINAGADPNLVASCADLSDLHICKSTFFHALQRGNTEIFKALINKGGDVNYCYQDNFWRDEYGYHKVDLLKFFAINSYTAALPSYQIPLLVDAVMFNNLEAVEYLLSMDADIYQELIITLKEEVFLSGFNCNTWSSSFSNDFPSSKKITETLKHFSALKIALCQIKYLESKDITDSETTTPLKDAIDIFKSIIDAGFDFYSNKFFHFNSQSKNQELKQLQELDKLSAHSKQEVLFHIFEKQGINENLITPNKLEDFVKSFNYKNIEKLLTYLFHDLNSYFRILDQDTLKIIIGICKEEMDCSKLFQFNEQDFANQKQLIEKDVSFEIGLSSELPQAEVELSGDYSITEIN